MKDTTKWILVAIVVLLILLVGAYALSNSNNTPTTNATVTPTATIVPTPTNVAGPSVTPTTTTTATTAPTNPTPTTTPTQSGSSGVKQTSYGYYITYPPFSDNEVHVNPNYVSGGSPTIDVVNFQNTATTLSRMGILVDDEPEALIRTGDLTQPLDVNIVSEDLTGKVSLSSNVVHFDAGETQVVFHVYITTTNNPGASLITYIYKVDIVSGTGYSIGPSGKMTFTVNAIPELYD
jgi:hypothetical protein